MPLNMKLTLCLSLLANTFTKFVLVFFLTLFTVLFFSAGILKFHVFRFISLFLYSFFPTLKILKHSTVVFSSSFTFYPGIYDSPEIDRLALGDSSCY